MSNYKIQVCLDHPALEIVFEIEHVIVNKVFINCGSNNYNFKQGDYLSLEWGNVINSSNVSEYVKYFYE